MATTINTQTIKTGDSVSNPVAKLVFINYKLEFINYKLIIH